MAATATTPAGPPPVSGGRLRRLYDRFEHVIHEVGKFGAVGAVAYMIDTVLYKVMLDSFQLETLTAKTLATVVSATVAFVGNRFWTWRHRARSKLHREYVLYFFFNVVGLGIALGCVALSHYGLGSVSPVFRSSNADLIAGNLVGTALGTIFRFWSYRKFVFLPLPAGPGTAASPLAPVRVTQSD
ncbi:MAG TPA: GtrA family protein [Micromonosporaceae bacterium]